MASQTPKRNDSPRPRRATLVLLAIVIFLLFGVIFSQAAFNLTFLRPDTSEQTLVFAALSAIIFLLLVTLSFVLVRNLLKLYLERQTAKLGSKFRTKMVLGALVLSFGPVIAMFLFSYGLMNRSIDKWFSSPAEEVREHTSRVTTLVEQLRRKQRAGGSRRHCRIRRSLSAHTTQEILVRCWKSSAAENSLCKADSPSRCWTNTLKRSSRHRTPGLC